MKEIQQVKERTREEAKRIYIEFAKSGKPLPLREFARRSEELLGDPVGLRTIKEWSTMDSWAREAEKYGSEGLQDLIDIAYYACVDPEIDDVSTVAAAASSFVLLLSRASSKTIVDNHEKITNATRWIYAILIERDFSRSISHLIKSWSQLRTYAKQIPEHGQDADEIIMRKKSEP